MKKILVTGGAGYIGSHTLIELIAAGFEPVVYDNLSNSSPVALERVEEIVGQRIKFIQGDVLDKDLLAKTYSSISLFVRHCCFKLLIYVAYKLYIKTIDEVEDVCRLPIFCHSDCNSMMFS